jgi:CheY-like chemotaxis protein/Tfp pilus assembly protein PilZ
MSDPKILLVDDSDFFLELEKGFLKHTPATLLTAANGVEALEVVSQHNPDLIFMDLSMPEMDGAACCARLKAHPRWRTIPVIMVYSPRSDQDVEVCRQSGCDEMLTKPVDRRLFLETGRRYLDKIDRRAKRVPCRFMVVFRCRDESGYAMSADLSTGGLYLSSEKSFRKADGLVLNFLLPGVGTKVIETEARVAWLNTGPCRPKPSYPEGFGVEFQGMTDDTLRLIRRYIESPP